MNPKRIRRPSQSENKELPAHRYLQVAEEAARRAGRILMRSYGRLKTNQIRVKSKNDFVTAVDTQSEKTILSTIRQHFPEHNVLGEEGGERAGGSSVTWIVDPLDGTANYIHQFPMFSISIGVSCHGHVVAGLIYDPLHNELFAAEKGRGAFLNGRRIRCSPVGSLAEALMTTGIPFRARDRFDEYMQSFRSISLAACGMRRGGSAALDLSYVACGRLDGFWELNLSPWDIAAGSLIVREAGGLVSDLWGHDEFLKSGDILASNRRIHTELLTHTRKVPRKER